MHFRGKPWHDQFVKGVNLPYGEIEQALNNFRLNSAAASKT